MRASFVLFIAFILLSFSNAQRCCCKWSESRDCLPGFLTARCEAHPTFYCEGPPTIKPVDPLPTCDAVPQALGCEWWNHFWDPANHGKFQTCETSGQSVHGYRLFFGIGNDGTGAEFPTRNCTEPITYGEKILFPVLNSLSWNGDCARCQQDGCTDCTFQEALVHNTNTLNGLLPDRDWYAKIDGRPVGDFRLATTTPCSGFGDSGVSYTNGASDGWFGIVDTRDLENGAHTLAIHVYLPSYTWGFDIEYNFEVVGKPPLAKEIPVDAHCNWWSTFFASHGTNEFVDCSNALQPDGSIFFYGIGDEGTGVEHPDRRCTAPIVAGSPILFPIINSLGHHDDCPRCDGVSGCTCSHYEIMTTNIALINWFPGSSSWSARLDGRPVESFRLPSSAACSGVHPDEGAYDNGHADGFLGLIDTTHLAPGVHTLAIQVDLPWIPWDFHVNYEFSIAGASTRKRARLRETKPAPVSSTELLKRLGH